LVWYNFVMSQYFDKDFFKFFLRFAAILSVSIIIIIAARLYQTQSSLAEDNTSAVIKTINK